MVFVTCLGAVRLGVIGLVSCSCLAAAENWPCWRGPRLDGTSLENDLALHWNKESNVTWAVTLPGVGHASPIVWEHHLFIAAAIPETTERIVLCLDRADGKIVWRQTVLSAPLEHKHSLNSYASSTPATDGASIFVAFLDRDRMYAAAYDFGGKRLWEARPGSFASMHGFCSSPILYRDKVILNGDHDGDSYLVAISKLDGHVIWKTPREHHTRSYCAPLIAEMAGRDQMILSGDKCVASYDPGSGVQNWVVDGPTEQFVASPVYSSTCGLVIITGGFPEHHILGIRPDGSGNVSGTHIAWHITEGAAYVPSPIIAGDYFLIVSDSGVAHCFEAASGHLVWKERLGEQHSSLVSAGGRVYFLNDKGVMNIVQPGPAFRLRAKSELGEKCFASPAISNGQLFIRGENHLFCIGQPR